MNPQPHPGADAGAPPSAAAPAAPAHEPAARASWAARWHGYRRAALGDDLVAALIVTILLVPQSLAYALLAGLPPVVGVMASLLPIVAYAAFGSSTTLAVGPVAVLSMMTAQAIVPAAQANGVGVHLAAMVLAVEIAGVFVLALLLRLDVFAALLSAPVLHGFVTGASLVIAIGQLPSLLGVAARGSTLTELLESLAQVPSVWPHAATAAIGLGALALLWLIRRHGLAALRALGLPARAAQLLARMAPMFVVVLSIAAVTALPQAVQGVALAGRVSLGEGLAFTPLWQAPAGLWLALAGPAALLGLVAYVESLAVAEALGARRGEKVLPRRELMGLAAANAAAGLSGAMPVTGGFARSIVNFDAGARTRVAGVWTALFLGLAILLLGDLLGALPKAVLAATIIVAVLSLVDLEPFAQAWRWSRVEFGLMVLVTALTVLAGVEAALLAGVLASMALLMQRTARPHWAEVGRLPGTEVFRNVRRFQVQTLPQVMAVRIDESLLFTNSRWLAETLESQAAARPGLRHLVLMMSGVNDIDFSGLDSLHQLDRTLGARGIRLHLSEVKGPLRDRLGASGVLSGLSGKVFATQAEAWGALGGMGGGGAASG
jgi:SulP family sulfate permease